MKLIITMILVGCVSVSSGCGSVMYSFYDLGKEGRTSRLKLAGTWYTPGSVDTRVYIDRVAGGYDVEVDTGDDDFDMENVRLQVVEHDEQLLFSAHQPRDVDSQLLLGVYVVGRIQQLGDCVSFQVLAKEAWDDMVAAGLPVATRRYGDVFTQEDEQEREIREGDFLKLFRVLNSEEPVALTIATPAELRAFLVATANDPVTYRSITVCPGEPPTTRNGDFDHARFAREHPEAAAYEQEFGP